MKKSFTYNQKLQIGFNFTYAGVCEVFITMNRKKYVVVCRGYELDSDNIVFFDRKKVFRIQCNSKYEAIDQFNRQCQYLTTSMDWFTEDWFESEPFKKNYNKRVYE